MRWAILLALAACGDDVRREPSAAPVSGSRLKLEWYFYGDGSREPNPEAFYDTLIHGRCTPRLWSDGEERCGRGKPRWYPTPAPGRPAQLA